MMMRNSKMRRSRKPKKSSRKSRLKTLRPLVTSKPLKKRRLRFLKRSLKPEKEFRNGKPESSVLIESESIGITTEDPTMESKDLKTSRLLLKLKPSTRS